MKLQSILNAIKHLLGPKKDIKLLIKESQENQEPKEKVKLRIIK
jgi:hypothetical protein